MLQELAGSAILAPRVRRKQAAKRGGREAEYPRPARPRGGGVAGIQVRLRPPCPQEQADGRELFGSSGATYNPGMDDMQTPAAVPPGTGRAEAGEPMTTPAAPWRTAADEAAPSELPLSELEFTGCKAVRVTLVKYQRISANYDTIYDSLGLRLVQACKPYGPRFSYASRSSVPSVVQAR